MSIISKKLPKISVIIPVYNREKYLAQAIESVLAQTMQDMEILVIDDGSVDQSPAIIAEYVRKYPEKFVSLTHPNQQHRGVSATRNVGIRQAKGEYIAFLDADDLWLPDKLQHQADILDVQQDIGFVYCAFAVIDEHGQPDHTRYGCAIIGDGHPGRNPQAFEELFSTFPSFGFGSTGLVRTAVLHDVGVFDESVGLGEDTILAMKIAYRYPIYFFAQPFVRYRVHSGAASCQMRDQRQCFIVKYVMMRRVCQWVKETSPIGHSSDFRVMLAQQVSMAYQQNHLSYWGFFKLLISLFPYASANIKILKIFVSICLGTEVTNTLRTMFRRIGCQRSR